MRFILNPLKGVEIDRNNIVFGCSQQEVISGLGTAYEKVRESLYYFEYERKRANYWATCGIGREGYYNC